MKMPFGRHKGLPLEECPNDYMRWLTTMRWVKAPLRQAVAQRCRQIDKEWEEAVRNQPDLPCPFEPTHINEIPIQEYHQEPA